MVGHGDTQAMLRGPNRSRQPSGAAPDNEHIRRMRREAHAFLSPASRNANRTV